MKYRLLLLSATLLLAGCVQGPLYPWQKCSPYGPHMLGCYYGSPCTAYHPDYFYRCHNNRCVTFSPYAPNRCDPTPYYTGCKYTLCPCAQNFSTYF